MLDNLRLELGSLVFFVDEKLPMLIMAKNSRYLIATRNFDKESDDGLLKYKVETGAYLSEEIAYENLKDLPVYTIIDLEKQKRGPSDLVFSPYDYKLVGDVRKALIDLNKEEHRISERNSRNLDIDIPRTEKNFKEDFFTRLMEEHNQLNSRMEGLNGFYHTEGFDNLPVEQQVLLELQLDSMRIYNSCLEKRINLLNHK